MPQPQSLTLHWLSWLFSSTVLPILPFLIYGGKAIDKAEGVLLILFALLVQLASSIYLARGVSSRRQLGVGGIIGLSVVFMMGSVAIGFAVFFVACLSTLNMQGFH
ncbi:MAG: hypothetical protein RL693_1990 [Verrucomicrobiota bacterium]|jgi:hypothetical protein